MIINHIIVIHTRQEQEPNITLLKNNVHYGSEMKKKGRITNVNNTIFMSINCEWMVV